MIRMEIKKISKIVSQYQENLGEEVMQLRGQVVKMKRALSRQQLVLQEVTTQITKEIRRLKLSFRKLYGVSC